jgi:nucleolar protein 56
MGSPFPIRLSHFSADTAVQVTASTTDRRGERFSTTTKVHTDGDGNARAWPALRDSESVSFATRTEHSSETKISDGVGGDGPTNMPFHHLDSDGDPNPSNFVALAPFDDEPLAVRESYPMRLEAGSEGESLASTTVSRVLSSQGVTKRSIPMDDLIGWLYEPEEDSKSLGVVLLHGSGGNASHDRARLLATYGYPALALKWLPTIDPPRKVVRMPFNTADIPVEYFLRAVDWLTRQDAVLDDRIGLVGASLGVAPAFLTAIDFDGRAAVIGYSGGGMLVPDIKGDDDPSRFSRDGNPVVTEEDYQREGPSAAILPAEEIDGPILMVTGQDDRLWNSYLRAEATANRLEGHDHPHPYSHVTYDDAGHAVSYPYMSYTDFDLDFNLGGTPSGDARAGVDSWVRMLESLEYVRTVQ